MSTSIAGLFRPAGFFFLLLFVVACSTKSPKPAWHVSYPEIQADSSLAHTLFSQTIPDPYAWMNEEAQNEIRSWSHRQQELNQLIRQQVEQHLDPMSLPNIGPFPLVKDPILRNGVFYALCGAQHRTNVHICRHSSFQELTTGNGRPITVGNDTSQVLSFKLSPDGNYLLAHLLKDENANTWLYPLQLAGEVVVFPPLMLTSRASYFCTNESAFYTVSERDSFVHSLSFRNQKRDRLEIVLSDSTQQVLPLAILNNTELIYQEKQRGGDQKIYALAIDRKRPRRLLAGFSNAVVEYIGQQNDQLYFRSDFRADHARIITLYTALNTPEARIRIVSPEYPESLEKAFLAGEHLLAYYHHPGRQVVRTFALNGQFQSELLLPESTWKLTSVCSGPEPEQFFFRILDPSTGERWYQGDIRDATKELIYQNAPPLPCTIETIRYKSYDGYPVQIQVFSPINPNRTSTKVPYLWLVDNNSPEALEEDQLVFPILRWFLGQGGALIRIYNRGSFGLGSRHRSLGSKSTIQLGMDDVQAGLTELRRQKKISPDQQLIWGIREGATLASGFLSQQPDLCSFVILSDGVFDPLSEPFLPKNTEYYEPPNTEFSFRRAYLWSAYYNISSEPLPLTLVLINEALGKYNRLQSQKLTARLQGNRVQGGPFLQAGWSSSSQKQGREQLELTMDLLVVLLKYQSL